MTLTNKLKEMRRKEEGFTIVELLIVIVVIAILAALVITSYLGIQSRARDSERQSDIRAIATAVQAHATVNDGQYPTCAEITTAGTDAIENLDEDALNPPNGPATAVTALSEGAVTAAPAANEEFYGCEQNPDVPGTPAGLTFTYWSEQEGAAVPRTVGDTTP